MESNLRSEYIYVIREDESYNKKVNCLTDYDQQINTNSNRKKQYLDGKYQGLPQFANVDFKNLL